MDADRFFKAMVERGGYDLFLKVGTHPYLRANGTLVPLSEEKLSAEQLVTFASELMGADRRQAFHAEREMNFSFDRAGIGRFRANVLWQQGTMALVIRRVNRQVPSFEELHLPAEVLTQFLSERYGLVLVTGPTGTGKSTTVAAMLEHLNHAVPKHIVTLEDPIEFQFTEEKAIINQREVGADTRSFREGLRNILRQSPDVLYLSDIRDEETMESCLYAAEAGQLVLSCIHTNNAVTTVERLVAFFPPHQHQLIRMRLAAVLKGVVSLRMLRRKDGTGRIPACEVLVVTPTIRELIREGRTEELPALIHDGAMYGMQTFTQALYQRVREGPVDVEEALRYADSPEELQLALREIRATKDVH